MISLKFMDKDVNEIMSDGIIRKKKTTEESIERIIFIRDEEVKGLYNKKHINYTLKIVFTDIFDKPDRQRITRNMLDGKIMPQFLNYEDKAIKEYLEKGKTIDNMIKNLTFIFSIKYKHLEKTNISYAYVETY